MNIKNKARTYYPSNAKWINNTIDQSQIIDLTKYDVPGTKEMVAERILQDYAITILPSVAHPSAHYSAIQCQKDLAFLNLKLDSVRKTITAWDVYNIRGVAHNEAEVDLMYTTATPNTAFICNEAVSKRHIQPGDVVFTDLNGVKHIIRHNVAGYFYPAQWIQQGTNTYLLRYHWSATPPESGQVTIMTSTENQFYDPIRPVENIGVQVDTNTSHGFSLTQTLLAGKSSESFDYIKNRVPLVTIFTEDGEKIWLDNILFKDTATQRWTITNITQMTIIVEVR